MYPDFVDTLYNGFANKSGLNLINRIKIMQCGLFYCTLFDFEFIYDYYAIYTLSLAKNGENGAFFYFYIYPPDSQESDRGAIHRVSNYPDLFPEMPRYCCPLVTQ